MPSLVPLVDAMLRSMATSKDYLAGEVLSINGWQTMPVRLRGVYLTNAFNKQDLLFADDQMSLEAKTLIAEEIGLQLTAIYRHV
jgi:hypothetical protein